MTNRKKNIATFATISLISILFCGLLIRKPIFASLEHSFISYLKSTRPEATLIAFSPTNHDPRAESRKVPSPESLRADLRSLRPAFDGLILYGYDKDVTPVILGEARRQGYRAVLLGIWDPKSDEEIAGIATLVKQYHHSLALAVCIGNEGVFFKRYVWQDLMTAAGRLRQMLGADIAVPITTSEPFKLYENPALQQFGDFLSPNIHTIFDHPEWDAAQAARWVREYAVTIAQVARKPALVKETGFPHAGQTRFTAEKQRDFWAAYTKEGRVASTPSGVWVSYAAAFEAFDLPWKAEQSGLAIEDAWGLMSVDRKPHAAFHVWGGIRLRPPR